MHATEYLAFGETLLARLYLKVKVYITKLLSVYIVYKKPHALNEVIFLDFYIFEDSSDLENLPLLNIELTLILQFCFFDDLLKLCFLTKCLFFSPQLMKRKRNKNQLFKYF